MAAGYYNFGPAGYYNFGPAAYYNFGTAGYYSFGTADSELYCGVGFVGAYRKAGSADIRTTEKQAGTIGNGFWSMTVPD